MNFAVYWCAEAVKLFPELSLGIGIIRNVHIEKENEKIKELKRMAYEEVRAKYEVEKLKDNPIIRAYRDFYWKLNIDPTKVRPSGEALLRRVLHGNELPVISTAVDAYNLASMKTMIPVSGFDLEKLKPPFNVRFANRGEEFLGIGMEKSITLTEKMLVLSDRERILCIYPYRDADYTKITEKTRNILIVGCGVPRIERQQLLEAVETALSYIQAVSGGEIEMLKVFNPSQNA
jgi:DNA/RNA-binding domain of Phe-tRNA-synthetase-like protein